MKIGAFTFGGGYAMISVIDNECVEKKKWITHDEFMNMTIIAESTPGPIAINCATYVGHTQAGVIGAVFATLGVVLPSFVIIFVISLFFNEILEVSIIAAAFQGIKIAVGVLIVTVGIKMLKNLHKAKWSVIILACSLAIILLINFLKWSVSSVYLILIAGLTGYIIFVIGEIRVRRKEGAEK